jgi:hypothetical protein
MCPRDHDRASLNCYRRQSTPALVWVVVIVGVVWSAACAPRRKDARREGGPSPRPDNSPAALVAAIRNEDVEWDGTLFGLEPRIIGSAARRVIPLAGSAVPALLDALEDPHRYVAAHVLLTWITDGYWDRPHGSGEAGLYWNGVRVHLHGDGTTTLEPSDMPRLQDRWREWLSTYPEAITRTSPAAEDY